VVLHHRYNMTGIPKMLKRLEPRTCLVELHPQDDVLSLNDLWLRCFALGSMNTALELEGFLRGTLRPTRHEYNLIAVALNEYLVEIGVSQSVQYIEDDGHSLVASWSGSAARDAQALSIAGRSAGRR